MRYAAPAALAPTLHVNNRILQDLTPTHARAPAGAAIHCWPSPTSAVAEISRVLKPGGHFVGSTFLDIVAPLGQFIGNDKLVNSLRQFDPTQLVAQQTVYKWWSEDELRDLFASVGLGEFQRQRSNRFILWSVQKPGAAQQHGAAGDGYARVGR